MHVASGCSQATCSGSRGTKLNPQRQPPPLDIDGGACAPPGASASVHTVAGPTPSPPPPLDKLPRLDLPTTRLAMAPLTRLLLHSVPHCGDLSLALASSLHPPTDLLVLGGRGGIHTHACALNPPRPGSTARSSKIHWLILIDWLVTTAIN